MADAAAAAADADDDDDMRRRRRIYDHLRWLSTPLPGCVEIPAASLSSY